MFRVDMTPEMVLSFGTIVTLGTSVRRFGHVFETLMAEEILLESKSCTTFFTFVLPVLVTLMASHMMAD